MPAMTKVSFAIPTVKDLLQLDRVAGIKDSSGDLLYFQQLVALARERPECAVLIGQEHLLPEAVRCGGHGVVGGGANFHPSLFVELYQAAVCGDAATVAALHQQVLEIDQIYRVGKEFSSCIRGTKCALSLLGICGGYTSSPFDGLTVREREKVRLVLKNLGLVGGNGKAAGLRA
ncbi:MAG: dihydrodipicolinate synthase family protein, partial [Verrucomicrobiota bacterium]